MVDLTLKGKIIKSINIDDRFYSNMSILFEDGDELNIIADAYDTELGASGYLKVELNKQKEQTDV